MRGRRHSAEGFFHQYNRRLNTKLTAVRGLRTAKTAESFKGREHHFPTSEVGPTPFANVPRRLFLHTEPIQTWRSILSLYVYKTSSDSQFLDLGLGGFKCYRTSHVRKWNSFVGQGVDFWPRLVKFSILEKASAILRDLAYFIGFTLFQNVWLKRSRTQGTDEMYRLNLRLQEPGFNRTRRRWSGQF